MKLWFPLGPALFAGVCLLAMPTRAEPPVSISPPVPEVRVPLPPPPREELQLPPLTQAQIAKITPHLEVWREGSNTPQKPVRRRNRVQEVLVAGDRPVVVRLQFDKSVSGKTISVVRANNVTLQTSEAVLRVRPMGECVVALLLDPAAIGGHLTFVCEGVETTVPLVRAPAATVAARENAANGGSR